MFFLAAAPASVPVLAPPSSSSFASDRSLLLLPTPSSLACCSFPFRSQQHSFGSPSSSSSPRTTLDALLCVLLRPVFLLFRRLYHRRRPLKQQPPFAAAAATINVSGATPVASRGGGVSTGRIQFGEREKGLEGNGLGEGSSVVSLCYSCSASEAPKGATNCSLIPRNACFLPLLCRSSVRPCVSRRKTGARGAKACAERRDKRGI